jgi:agmatine deiminase
VQACIPVDQDDPVARKVIEIEGRSAIARRSAGRRCDSCRRRGTLLATEECLLNLNRKSAAGCGSAGDPAARIPGISSVVWLSKGVVDETGGHVDNLCCSARPGEVVLT